MNIYQYIIGGLVAVIVILTYIADRYRARIISQQTIMKMYVDKSVQDRNHMVRIPAEMVHGMFDLGEKVRFIKEFKPWPQRRKHPALERKVKKQNAGA